MTLGAGGNRIINGETGFYFNNSPRDRKAGGYGRNAALNYQRELQESPKTAAESTIQYSSGRDRQGRANSLMDPDVTTNLFGYAAEDINHFDTIDRDNSVSRAEFEKNFGRDEKSIRLFKTVDTNGDGEIGLVEMAAYVRFQDTWSGSDSRISPGDIDRSLDFIDKNPEIAKRVLTEIGEPLKKYEADFRRASRGEPGGEIAPPWVPTGNKNKPNQPVQLDKPVVNLREPVQLDKPVLNLRQSQPAKEHNLLPREEFLLA